MDSDFQNKKILEDHLRELYGRSVWTHKTQEKCADILKKRNDNLKLTQIILSALTTTGILVSVFGESFWVGISSAILSAVLFAISTYNRKYDLGELSKKHSDSASDIWYVREKYLSLLADLKSGDVSIDEIRSKRDIILTELHKIYKGAPRTISKAYKEATQALKSNEELTFSVEEIDMLLPNGLRIN